MERLSSFSLPNHRHKGSYQYHTPGGAGGRQGRKRSRRRGWCQVVISQASASCRRSHCAVVRESYHSV